MKASTYSIREFGYLLDEGELKGKPLESSGHAIAIPHKAFKYLLGTLRDETSEDYGAFLTLTTYRRTVALKVQNYVGVLRAPCGTQIEILPKLYQAEHEASDETSRQILIKMLRTLRNSPFKDGGKANIYDTKMPLLDVYIQQFLALTILLVKRGLRSDYVRTKKQASFLKGRLCVSEQIRHNALHPARFAIECDEYLVDRPANRLIKTTLNRMAKVARTSCNQRLARELGFVFDTVPESLDIKADFQRVKINRGMGYYNDLLAWCRLLLFGQGPAASQGDFNTLSLLYPMERLFEDFVSHALRKQVVELFGEGCELETQAAKHSLVEEHVGGKMFQLRPDLLVQRDGKTVCVMDTKWKLLDGADRRRKYGISQADMYQLYAYGHKYLTGVERKDLLLIYPATDKFREPLPPFMYEDGHMLRVVPFDCESCSFYLIPPESDLLK